MKKSILVLILLVTVAVSNAQNTETITTTTVVRSITNNYEGYGVSNTDAFISGSINYQKTIYGSYDTSSFDFKSRFGYFFSDNFVLGLSVGYSDRIPEELMVYEDFENKYTTLEYGIFSRCYFQPNSKFSIFLEASINKITSNLKIEPNYYSSYDNQEFKFKGYVYAITPGINYFLNRHFALEANWGVIRYETEKLDEEGADSLDNFSIGLSFEDISLGLLYKF